MSRPLILGRQSESAFCAAAETDAWVPKNLLSYLPGRTDVPTFVISHRQDRRPPFCNLVHTSCTSLYIQPILTFALLATSPRILWEPPSYPARVPNLSSARNLESLQYPVLLPTYRESLLMANLFCLRPSGRTWHISWTCRTRWSKFLILPTAPCAPPLFPTIVPLCFYYTTESAVCKCGGEQLLRHPDLNRRRRVSPGVDVPDRVAAIDTPSHNFQLSALLELDIYSHTHHHCSLFTDPTAKNAVRISATFKLGWTSRR